MFVLIELFAKKNVWQPRTFMAFRVDELKVLPLPLDQIF